MALILAGCVPMQSQILGKDQAIVIYPKLSQDSRSLQSIVNLYTLSSIATLDIVPYVETTTDTYQPISSTTGTATDIGAADVLKISQSSPSIDPSRPFIFRKLKPNKKYRVYGRAYNQANALISLDNTSYVDVAVGNNDTPAMANLPVNLLGTVFGASTSVSLKLIGRYDYLKSTLYQISGGGQVSVQQTTLLNPEIFFNNLQGNTNYRLVLEAYKLGSMFASTSVDLNIGNETAPASQSVNLTIPYVVSTLAGALGTSGAVDGAGNQARFNWPYSVAVDANGNIFVSDRYNHAIRKITSDGVVSTFAGLLQTPGYVDAAGNNARFNYPLGLAFDSSGNLYVADGGNNCIRKITSAGAVTTLAGLAGSQGTVDGVANVARFNAPHGIAVDGAGNVYVGDYGNHAIRKVTSGGVVSTLAGALGNAGALDGNGNSARFNNPQGVAVDPAGNVYVADGSNHAIRKITSDGTVTTFAGLLGNLGSVDGTGNAARFNCPAGVALDVYGNLFVAERDNHSIRRVTSSGVATFLAGSLGNAGAQDGTGAAAKFDDPHGIAVDLKGNVFVVDYFNDAVRVLR